MASSAHDMKPGFQRRVSPLERIFLLLARIDTPFSNQMIVEGEGVLDAERWQNAVAAACAANPGSRLIYCGKWAWAKWVDSGKPAPIRHFDGRNWSGDSHEGAPFLLEPLPFETDHSCEVVLLSGNPLRVVFRTLHATMDGSGTMVWAHDIFRALRREPLVGSASTITDGQLVSRSGYKVKWERKPRKCLAPSGSMIGNAPGYVWKRAMLKGRYSKLLPQAAVAIAKETRKQGPCDVRFNIPVDLRRRTPGVISTANLTRRIVLDVAPEDTVDMVQQQLNVRLEELSGDPKLLKVLSYAPLGWIELAFKVFRNRNLRTGIYRSTGSISNLGRLPIESFCGGGFEARTAFFVPPGTEAKPFFMTLAGSGIGVELLVSMPTSLANQGRLDQFIANVIADLKPAR